MQEHIERKPSMKLHNAIMQFNSQKHAVDTTETVLSSRFAFSHDSLPCES